jgi:phosphoserine phosphatase RsbU/P
VTVELQPGDGLVFYTDGIIEAENEAHELYGLERLCAVVTQHWAHSIEEIKRAVTADVIQYIGTQKILDDLTLVIMKQHVQASE